MNETYTKQLPTIDEENRPFWEGARRGELTLQCCEECQHVRYPLSICCPQCLCERFSWVKLSGRGWVFSSITFYHVYDQAFAGDVPYNVSLIQLEEGPRMYSNVTGVPPDEVNVGDRVEVWFDAVTDQVSIPKFRHAAR